MKNVEYLKKTAFWQDFISAASENTVSDEIVGRFYWIGWKLKDVESLPEFFSWQYPIVLKKDATQEEKYTARNKGFYTAWSKYKEELEKMDSMSIAPARIVPESYKGLISYFDEMS